MLLLETFYVFVYSISVGDVGEVEIVPYSLFVRLNIGGINHFHFTTNKPKDQGRTGFMKLVIVKGWFIKDTERKIYMTMVCFFPSRVVRFGL